MLLAVELNFRGAGDRKPGKLHLDLHWITFSLSAALFQILGYHPTVWKSEHNSEGKQSVQAVKDGRSDDFLE